MATIVIVDEETLDQIFRDAFPSIFQCDVKPSGWQVRHGLRFRRRPRCVC